MDIKSKEERSLNMAKIKAKDTAPEIFIRSALHRHGFRFRVNYKEIEGNPDIYFSKRRIAIFVHGCYWHRHKGCTFAYTPKSNEDFWNAKFNANENRDKVVLNALLNDGIRVLIIWECSVKQMMKNADMFNFRVSEIECFIKSNIPQYLEI